MMHEFSGKTMVMRIDEATAAIEGTLLGDLEFLREQHVYPIVVAPNAEATRALVRSINRCGNTAVGLSGSDAALLPLSGEHVGVVQTAILQTLTSTGYIPVVEPSGFAPFGGDAEIEPDEVASALGAATEAVRVLFFNARGGVNDPDTAALIEELTPSEALVLSESDGLPLDLRAAIRAAASGVRQGVSAAQILDGRVAHASIVEVLTSRHLGTQVTGAVYIGGTE